MHAKCFCCCCSCVVIINIVGYILLYPIFVVLSCIMLNCVVLWELFDCCGGKTMRGQQNTKLEPKLPLN